MAKLPPEKYGSDEPDDGPIADDNKSCSDTAECKNRGGAAKKKKSVKSKGHRAKPRADKMARSGSEKWMKSAVKHPGALHRDLGVPEGKKIPEKKLEKAEHSKNPTVKKRAVLAETFKKERNK